MRVLGGLVRARNDDEEDDVCVVVTMPESTKGFIVKTAIMLIYNCLSLLLLLFLLLYNDRAFLFSVFCARRVWFLVRLPEKRCVGRTSNGVVIPKKNVLVFSSPLFLKDITYKFYTIIFIVEKLTELSFYSNKWQA